MKVRKLATLFCGLMFVTLGAWAQGLGTPASKDDWEEINFEYNSSVLVDGFPSLLRLAELLQTNAAFKVRIEGHTDGIGSETYNQKLGLARANTVRDFLVKYGARTAQMETVSRGKANPKAPGQRTVYGPTDEARYMNRRAVLTVMDAQGRTVGAGSAGDAIRAITQNQSDAAKQAADCCSEVLKRLDKLDDIAKMLRDLNDQNAALRKELADLKAAQDQLRAGLAGVQGNSGANAGAGANSGAGSGMGTAPSASDIATAVSNEIDKRKDPRFQLMGLNLGADDRGNVAFTGSGRYFAPFASRFAIQAQAEYMYGKTQREGQFDLGLVDRLTKRFQAGLFSSFKHATLANNQTGVTLGQAALTLDYLFSRGRLGLFGTKGFLDGGVINRANAIGANGLLMRNVIEERYVNIVDQAGVSGTIGLFKNVYAVGNLGYLRSYAAGDRMGGTLRLVFPISDKIAFTAEGGVNETLLSRENNGRAVFGVQFGNFLRPKQYLGVDHAIPAEVPRVRYEVLTRRLRVGNDPPVADAGPDQANVAAGTVQLDASNSYDPDGDPITFQWFQDGGAPVTIANATAAKASFNAALGQLYTFRVVVKDDRGAQASARVRISTRSADRVQILFFLSDPRQIPPGQTANLSWRVINADTVSIAGIGTVAASGSVPVTPSQTTTYTITGRSSVNEESASTVVAVVAPPVRLLYCYASPANIAPGDSATLNWSAPDAATVSITPGIGTVAKSGSVSVTPTQTTAYTVTATSADGRTQDSCGIVVNVGGAGAAPRIIRFVANPATINSGQNSNLDWAVENADTVSITGLGTVPVTGNRNVTPAATTNYTITATNKYGTASATATVNVNVIVPTTITSFTADPAVITTPGQTVNLTCNTTGATSMLINGILFLPPSGRAVVFPTQTTTYTCVATGPNGQSDTKTVTVEYKPPVIPPVEQPTVVIAGGTFQQTIYRDIIIDASQSSSPQGYGPLTYSWTVRNNQAAILNPTSPTPRVQLGIIGGDYLFDLTVTDSKGNKAVVTVTIRFQNIHQSL